MMNDQQSLLSTLQHGDSFFPSGMTALSSGLEGLVNDQLIVSSKDVNEFVIGQLINRWAHFDRPILVATSKISADLRRAAGIDFQVDAQSLGEGARNASIRMGKALLGVHIKMQTHEAISYQKMILDSQAVGHISVIQGIVWKHSGIPQWSIELMSAHGFSVGITGAALRLGLIGHIDVQKIITNTHSTILKIVAQPAIELDQISAFTPQQEIAIMRHETQSHRLFIN